MAQLSIVLLGSFRVALDGEPVTGFVSDKARALLAFLAVEAERAHRREILVGLLWPEYPERAARANLRNVLSNVRQVIGDREADPPFLCIERQTIQFNSEADAQVDVRTFTEGLEPAGDSPPARAEAIHELEAAMALYQGEFLEGFSLPDSAAFEEWALLKREQLQRQALAALGRLADHYEQQGDYERALRFAWRRVEADPYRGVAQRGLMRLLALSGQREPALAQYDTFRRLLADEMGVAPAEETTRLCEQIQAGELTPPAPLLWVGAQESLVPRHNLPAAATPFIGREAELAKIGDLLRDPACRLVSLIGPGGSGKTRLALEAAADILSDAQVSSYEHGIYFVSLAPLRSPDSIVPTVAQAIGFSFYGEREPRQQLLDYLHQKCMLLVMDNFEHLLSSVCSSEDEGGENKGGESLVIDILKTAPNVKVLTTSRARLNLRGEHLFPVGGMDLPPLLSSEDEEQYDAVELFSTGARRAEPGFELTGDNAKDVVRVCRLVEGMPLGILLAAAWTRLLTPGEIADQVKGGIDFLATEGHDVPARQRSMRATLAHSWRLLTEREREVFRALSVFRGGFTREAAQAVTGVSLQELMALVDKSLLHRAPTGRYEIHELLRQYAADKLRREEKLDESPAAAEAAHDQHCSYYTAALQQWAADLKGPRQQAALAEMDLEIENARAAWTWAVEQGQVERLDQALEGLCRFYDLCGRWQEGEAACRVAADRLATGKGMRVRAKALAWQGRFSLKLRGTGPALELQRQSLELLEMPELAEQDTRSERAFILWQMGEAMAYRGYECTELFEQALALYRELGDRWGMAYALEGLGWLDLHSGTYGEARRLFEECLAIRRSLDDRMEIARSLLCLGNVARDQGQLEEGERLLRECIALCQESGDRVHLAEGFLDLANTLVRYLGKFAEAYPLIEKGEAIYSDLGRRDRLALSNLHRGWWRMHQGQYEQAHERARAALTIAREVGYPSWISGALCVLGGTVLAEGAYAEAQDLLEESRALHQESGLPDDTSQTLPMLGYAARAVGQRSQARQHLSKALRAGAETGDFLLLVSSLPAAALLLADRGEKERAVELYALASRYPMVANSQWCEDVAGRHIAEVAATLPPDVVAAAQERGRARDLDATVKELLAELAT
jgi:predicted ATPase/DNA-binding SARP family transcriptional activator